MAETMSTSESYCSRRFLVDSRHGRECAARVLRFAAPGLGRMFPQTLYPAQSPRYGANTLFRQLRLPIMRQQALQRGAVCSDLGHRSQHDRALSQAGRAERIAATGNVSDGLPAFTS